MEWSTLHVAEDPEQASMIATAIAAMEFEVRLRDEVRIEVRPADRADLQDVLEEIIDEQEDFDAGLAARRRRADRRLKIFGMALAAAVLVTLILTRCG
ncbi:MAG: hypothetical protein ACYTGP_02555 [Planctomycetota bacterium]|jgi:hypothetical protein